MTDYSKVPVFGPQMPALAPAPDSATQPETKAWRSLAKALSWRAVGSLDTWLLSYMMISYIGPYFGLEHTKGEALQVASYIAITEVATKILLYYFHERFWVWLDWGSETVDGRRRETYRLTLAKTISFRTIATLDTVALAWFFTGNVATALSIGGLEVVTKLILYFFHERLWARLPFGMVR